MEEEDDVEPTLLEYSERQTRALERLLLLHQVVLSVSVVALLIGAIAYFGR